MKDNMYHFKGIREESEEERKKRKQKEFKRQWNEYVLKRTEEVIIQEIIK